MNEIIDPRSVDRPNSYIGKSVPRPNTKKLVEGRGQFVDDIVLPRMVHVAYVRSPHAHARIAGIDANEALNLPGVVRIFSGKDLAKHCEPWVAILAHLKGMKSAPQRPLPIERTTWVGEAVAAVVAETRAIAEDAVAKVNVSYEPLPAVVDMETALSPGMAVIHPDLGDNLCFQRVNESGKVDDAFAAAHKVVEATFHTGRHTGATLEPRSILAEYNRASAKLTVYHATQAPHMMQGVFAKHMGLPEGDVRVICTDIGGSYGIKVHVYPDEIATAVNRQDAGPAGEVHRRPAGELLDRHPRPRPPHQGPHGRRRRGAHHGHRHRRPDRHRPLLGLPAHQRGGRQPGGEPGRRALRLRQLPRQDHGGAAEQDADLPVPRRRPPHRHARSPKASSISPPTPRASIRSSSAAAT